MGSTKTMRNFYIHVCAKWFQSCLTFCDPMGCSPPGSLVHRISQERVLEWVAFPFSRGSSPPRDRTQVSCIAGDALPSELPGKPGRNTTGSPFYASGNTNVAHLYLGNRRGEELANVKLHDSATHALPLSGKVATTTARTGGPTLSRHALWDRGVAAAVAVGRQAIGRLERFRFRCNVRAPSQGLKFVR